LAGNTATIILGIMLYIIGIISANLFFEPIEKGFTFHPAIELMIFSLAIFVLSGFFYGRIAFVLLLFAGIFLGQSFSTLPLLGILGLMPLLLALLGGKFMGETAKEDLNGKKNFFEEKQSYIAYVILIIISSLLIGFVFGVEIALPAL